MKILNLYAGLGGNRRLLPDNCEVTAVEWRSDIADFYANHYPDDEVIVADAHSYLLEHINDGWNFIWASPPCPSHSRARYFGHKSTDPIYPDMKLYEEILFLKHHFSGKWVVENVIPYYDPMMYPQKMGRHLFWSNFNIYPFDQNDADIKHGTRGEWEELHGISLEGYKFSDRTDKLLRNCVNSELALHIFNSAWTDSPATLQQQGLGL